MNNSNSFNICPQCGCSNSLSARFCARCGSKLTVPEEVVVCPKCHTRNSALANYCRNCGASIKVGAVTKICPQCGREVNAEDSICTCGHSFAHVEQTNGEIVNSTNSPVTQQNVVGDVNVSKKDDSKTSTGKGKGRVIAFFAFILSLVFAYFLIVPASFQFNSGENLVKVNLHDISAIQNFTRLFHSTVDSTEKSFYGYDVVLSLVSTISNGTLSNLSVADWIACVAVVLFVLVVFFYVLVALIRIFSGKRSKGFNVFLFMMADVYTVLCLLTWLFASKIIPVTAGSFMETISKVFIPSFSVDYGYIIAIPVFYWFFFIYSFCAKEKSNTKKNKKSR